MASILRSSKFVRYIAGFARNIVVNTPREFDGSVLNFTQCSCGAIPRSFATQASTQHDQTLDSCIKRLDQDVKRVGRLSRRDIEDVLEELRNAHSATSSQSLMVIRCCGNLVPEELPETRTKLVQEIWNTLNKLKVPMDISHYNALLRVYLENEHEFSPTDFLSELESKGLEPNRVTYQRLISKYCQNGDIEGATRILEFMREKQLPVNESVFNALIVGHSKSGDLESAQGILAVMSQAGLEPSADTYTTLLCGYAEKGDMESINSLINECESQEIILIDKDFLEVIYALTVNGHSQHVPEMISKIKKNYGYNQDVVVTILRLINKGHDDTAYLLLKTMPRLTRSDGSVMASGGFLLKQMIKANRPLAKIVQMCNNLTKDELFNNPLSYATEFSLESGNEELVYGLLNELKSGGLPIRCHYFWPLIVSKSRTGSDDDVIKVLHNMSTMFNIHPNIETIREYVIPNLKGKSSEILEKLRSANISIGSAASSLIFSLLSNSDIQEAALIIERVTAYYHPDNLRKPLTSAFYKTNNVDAYITILRHIYENLDRKVEVEQDERTTVDKNEVIGKFLLDLAKYPRQFESVVEKVLAALVNQGLSISTSTAERIEDKLGERMTPEISQHLGRLSSGDLSPTPIERKQPSYTPSSQMNALQLERLIQNLEAKGQETKGLKRQLLTLYYKDKNLEKMEELFAKLESDTSFQSTPGIYAQLLDTCAFHENYDATMKYLQKLKEVDNAALLDESKVIRVVTVMVKNDKIDEAIEFLKQPKEKKPDERSYTYNSLCWRLLNHLAEKGEVDKLQKVFDTLDEHDYLQINNVLLGPLVKVHLVNNDTEKAIERFEWCCTQYRATPFKNELTCKLIQAEDAERLQKLTDLSTTVHGEINSLYDLVFAFVECGRVRQARKILETPGLYSRTSRINVACQRYQEEGMVKSLEGLCEATKDLNHIDRSDIYYQLLLSYIKQDDPDKALALWTQMQDEDLPPTDNFLYSLGTFLKAKNRQIPFAMPENPVTPVEKINITPSTLQLKKDATLFRQCLKNGDVDKALEIKNNTKEVLTVVDLSNLVEKLIQSERNMEATKIVEAMLNKQMVPVTRVFRFLLNKLANNGEVESLNTIGRHLNSNIKKLVSFDNRICHANLVAGKAEEYLGKLEAEIDAAQDKDLDVISEKFPRGGAVGILERCPELLEKYEVIAFKYAKRGIVTPVNVLWSHYFINNNETKAEEVWKQYMQGAPRIMFQRVVQHARETNNEALAEKLISHLKTSNVTEGALGNAYSCLLDVLYNKQKEPELIDHFEKAIKTIPIDSINRTAVLRVKEAYEKLGKPFTHKIPPKHVKGGIAQTSSSSSSSDDENNRQPKKT